MPLQRQVVSRWLQLDGRGSLRGQIYRAIRAEVLGGELRPGARLPSTRTLARDLGVSRNTTQDAYDQLYAEGYLVTRRGSGTFVAPGLIGAGPAAEHDVPEAVRPGLATARLSGLGRRVVESGLRYPYDELMQRPPAMFEFLSGIPDPTGFPLELWRRIASRRTAEASVLTLAYSAPEGQNGLREAIAEHVLRARGVRCRPEQVVVTGGIQQGLQLVSRLLVDPGDSVLIEEPHYPVARMALQAEGANLVPAAVDGEGVDLGTVDAARLAACKLAHVTPSHQFPTGAVLSLQRRQQLLSWAREQDAFVLEDDYDSEFRYEGRPIESLQGLDRAGRVIYAGTFAKTLFPGLRLGYLVLPEPLVEPVRTLKWLADWSAPSLPQETLEEFIREGHFERHVRRQRSRNAGRRQALLQALQRHLGERVRLVGANAGLHLLAWLPGVPASESGRLEAEARERGVGVYPVTPCYLRPPEITGLVLGYGILDEELIDEGIRILAGAVRAVSK